MSGETFLSRWSKKKIESRHELAKSERSREALEADDGKAPAGVVPHDRTAGAAEPPPGAPAPHAQPLAPPTADAFAGFSAPASSEGAPRTLSPTVLPDIESLTPESDFRPFLGRDVDPKLKNQALKQLFKDPHYNVMDRLDIYIDDYTQPDPIPDAMLRQMTQSKLLGLFKEEEEEEARLAAAAAAETGAPGDSAAAQHPTEADARTALASDEARVRGEAVEAEPALAADAARTASPQALEQNDAPATKSPIMPSADGVERGRS